MSDEIVKINNAIAEHWKGNIEPKLKVIINSDGCVVISEKTVRGREVEEYNIKRRRERETALF